MQFTIMKSFVIPQTPENTFSFSPWEIKDSGKKVSLLIIINIYIVYYKS